MAYLFCLFDAQRSSRRRAGRMNGVRGAATRPLAMRLRVVSIRAVSRSERGSGAGCLYVGRFATLLFIYLKEAKLIDWRRRLSVEKKFLFVHHIRLVSREAF